jgi:vitamin B12 transporter
MVTFGLALATARAESTLEPILITAGRVAETASESLASVSVIDRATIERTQATSVPDALRGLPGVALRSNGGLGHNTNLYLRGTNPDHVLLLLDGLKLGSATSGFLPWGSLPIQQLDRVEMVRGPRSSLYGSDAIGGVVQLFTSGRELGPLAPNGSATLGTYGTVEGQVGVAGEVPGTDGAVWLNAGAGYRRSDGFDVCVDVSACGVDEPDDDGYRNRTLRFAAGWEASEHLELDVTFLQSTGELEYDGSPFFGNRRDTEIAVFGGGAVLRPNDVWTSRLRGGRSRDDNTIFFDGAQTNLLNTRRDQLSWLNDLQLTPSQKVTLGVDALRDTLEASTDFAETRRDNIGVFGQYRGEFAGHGLHAGLRYDDNEQFGGKTTGNLAWGHRLSNGLRATASFGTAFKAPSFNDLYFPGFGDPDLEPETSQSVEVGLAGDHSWGDWSLNIYQTDIDDLIAFDAATFSPQNIDQARIRGLEFSAGAEWAAWDMGVQLTLMDPRNRSPGPDRDKLLQRRPEQTFRLDADRAFDRVSVGGTLFAAGRRFDDDANEVRLDGFMLVDLRGEYRLSRTWRLQGRVENLLDEDYQTAAGFAQPGRSFFVTLRYQH